MSATATEELREESPGGPARQPRTDEPRSDAPVGRTPSVGLRAIFRRFRPFAAPLRPQWAITLVLVAVTPGLSAAAIWLFKILVDDVVVPHDFRLFPLLAGCYLGLALVQGAVSFADEYLTTVVGERFVLSLRARLFDHLHQLSPGFLERRQLGDILSRLTGDIGAIEELVLSGVAQALTYACQLLWFSVALFALDWRLAAVSMLVAPAFLAATRSFTRRIKEVSRERRRLAGSITAVAEESLGNAALVRAYHHRQAENDRFAKEAWAAFRAQMTATRLRALFGPLTDMLEVVGVLLVIGLAVWELARGRITIGGVMAFVTYLTRLYGPIQGAGRLANSLYSASASAERVIELLDESPSPVNPSRPLPLRRARGTVEFDAVDFRYPGSPTAALTGVDLHIRPGETVALVGASGAGKSTLAKLLLRFDDPSAGVVAIDGLDLRELAPEDLYRNVAAVLQETLVFDATIGENIRWGKPDATDSEVVAAAEAADAAEFIRQLPQGYDTRVGQRGRLLSGGQRQRLAIARAMIRDAPILLLDEPTTGLDAASTNRLLGPLRRLMSGRTTLVISHNLLTVTDADRIVYIENGRVTAQGRHVDLMRVSPGYADLYELHRTRPVPSARPGEPEGHGTEPIGAAGRAAGGGHATGQCTRNTLLMLDRLRVRQPGRTFRLTDEVSLAVEKGRCLAVLGDGGSGKSALLRVLARLERPARGDIRYLPDVSMGQHGNGATKPSRSALVLTRPRLISGTVADNIRLRRPTADHSEVVAAASAVGVHESIQSLPAGYATRVGPGGEPVPPATVIRIVIAGALLVGPDLLLLDEPSAGLDRAARNELLAALCLAVSGRTTVIATRDPLVAALADRHIRLSTTRPTHSSTRSR